MNCSEKAFSPLFSIITVTWNAAATLPATIASIAAQTCRDFEWLVQDGASSDATMTLVEQSGIEQRSAVSEKDGGLYDAMNRAIDRAAGRYLIFLNAGDAFAAPDVLQRLANVIALSPSGGGAEGGLLPGVIYGQTRLVDAERHVTGMRHLTAPEHLTADSFKQGMLVCHQAFIARRDLAPHYDLRYRYSADYDWCVKILKRSTLNVYAGDAPLIDYLDEGLTTRNEWRSLRERFKIMCHHYGTVATALRHISFAPRFLRRKLHL